MAIVAGSASVADEQSRPSLRQPLANRTNKTADPDSQNRITKQAITSKSRRVDVRAVCIGTVVPATPGSRSEDDTDRRTTEADCVSEPASREKAGAVAEADWWCETGAAAPGDPTGGGLRSIGQSPGCPPPAESAGSIRTGADPCETVQAATTGTGQPPTPAWASAQLRAGQINTAAKVVRWTTDWTAGPRRRRSQPADNPTASSTEDCTNQFKPKTATRVTASSNGNATP